MSSAMFIKSALALILTVGFAGGAVYYGTQAADGEHKRPFSFAAPKTNEVNVTVPKKADEPSPAEKKKTAQKTSKKAVKTKTTKKPPARQQVAKKTVKKQVAKKAANPISEPQTAGELDLKRIMPMLMVQAGRIKNVDIKDQAYLDIVSFSVSQRQFYFADAALAEIDQPELRDTARSQIAIALALDGKADEAFEVIDQVEIATLRDVMRLQVIEALILPEKLPRGLR